MIPPRVLVVDDEADMRASVERILAEDYIVLACSDGATALERLAEFGPDVALLDIRMPRMDGFELLDALRERDPGLDVILMTGSLTEPDAKLIRAIRGGAYYYLEKPLHRDVLLTLLDRCLTTRRLANENRRHERRKARELDAARAFQIGMLPRDPPPETRGRAAWAYVPSSELSGDFMDVVWLGSDRVAVIVADVVGHGAAAAMLTASLKAAFQIASTEECAPEQVIDLVLAMMHPHGPERFVTLICARFDRMTETLEYVNAGHPAGLVYRDGEPVAELSSSGPIVNSAIDDAEWTVERIRLQPGDVLLLMTDGVLEARRGDEEFGIGRVHEVVREIGADPGKIVEAVVRRVVEFVGDTGGRDDITLFCLVAGKGPAYPADRLGLA